MKLSSANKSRHNFLKAFAATTDAQITQAVNEFKAYLVRENKGEDGNKVFKQGKYFNMDLYIKALELYDACYRRNGGMFAPKNFACWSKVIGSIQRYLPTSYMQVIAQGIDYIVEGGRWLDDATNGGKEKLTRSMKFSGDSQPYFSGTYDGSLLSLGNDYAGERGRSRCIWGTGWDVITKTYVRQKQQNFGTLCSQASTNIIPVMNNCAT